MKLASVIVAVNGNAHTVRATVDSLLAQSYCGLVEIILVGDRDNPAWSTLWREIETGQVQVVEIDGDLEAKRAAGLAAATGDVLCFAPEATIPARHWVSTIVAMSQNGNGAVRSAVMPAAYQ